MNRQFLYSVAIATLHSGLPDTGINYNRGLRGLLIREPQMQQPLPAAALSNLPHPAGPASQRSLRVASKAWGLPGTPRNPMETYLRHVHASGGDARFQSSAASSPSVSKTSLIPRPSGKCGVIVCTFTNQVTEAQIPHNLTKAAQARSRGRGRATRPGPSRSVVTAGGPSCLPSPLQACVSMNMKSPRIISKG